MTGMRHPELNETAQQIVRLLDVWPQAERNAILDMVDTLIGESDPFTESATLDSRPDPEIEALAAWQLILPRTRNCLIMDPVFEVESRPLRLSDVASRTLESLALVPNFGRICYYDLLQIMERYGWNFSLREPREIAVPAHFFHHPDEGRATVAAEANERRRSVAFDLELLKCKDEEKLTYVELAARHGISVRVAKERVSRARHIEALRASFSCPE